jgi:hypothetical protein
MGNAGKMRAMVERFLDLRDRIGMESPEDR